MMGTHDQIIPGFAEVLVDGLEAAAAGICLWNPERELVFINQAFQQGLGIADGHILRHLRYDVFLRLIVSSRECILDSSPETWLAEHEAGFGLENHFVLPMADGRTLEIINKPTKAGGMAITLHDISALRQREQIIRQAKELAEESDKTKSRFLRAANHDLRQPLASLKILVYTCMFEQDDENRKDILHAMDISISIMEDLLSALLQIGQLDAGRIQPRITGFQLDTLFQRLKIQFGHQASAKGLSLNFVETRNTILSDKGLLERILSNLVANAIKYTDFGGVLIGCRRSGSSLRIEVWDSGYGIQPDHLPKIFDEFYQVITPARKKKKGLGLGLNIVQRLSQLLGHEISVRSTPGKGTVFSITVPLGDVVYSNTGETDISEMIGGQFSGISILVLEDDDFLRHAIASLLERWGINVQAMASPEEAFQLMETSGFRPRLIISDYSLRGHYGTAVIESIQQYLGSSLPGIIITADMDPAVAAATRNAGFPILLKPLSPPRLRVLMHQLIFEGP